MRATKKFNTDPPAKFRPYTITLHVDDWNDEGNLEFMINQYNNRKDKALVVHTPIEKIELAMKGYL